MVSVFYKKTVQFVCINICCTSICILEDRTGCINTNCIHFIIIIRNIIRDIKWKTISFLDLRYELNQLFSCSSLVLIATQPNNIRTDEALRFQILPCIFTVSSTSVCAEVNNYWGNLQSNWRDNIDFYP